MTPTTPTHLSILWTTDSPTTFHEMVHKYALNSRLQQWWEEVTLIIWGACKGCSDNLGVTPTLEELGVDVKYWGAPLTEILKADGKLITI